MRHRLAALGLIATTAFAPTLVAAAPAHALTLQQVYYNLPESICNSFGQSGQQNGRWSVWWCSVSQPENGWNYTYDLWAYV